MLAAAKDECILASDIYECNMKNNPPIAQAVVTLVNTSYNTPIMVYFGGVITQFGLISLD